MNQVALPDSNHLVQNETFRVNGTFTGLNLQTLYNNTWPHFGKDYTTPHGDWTQFASVFGVLFSGVTGIMAGANMSGKKFAKQNTCFCLLLFPLNYHQPQLCYRGAQGTGKEYSSWYIVCCGIYFSGVPRACCTHCSDL